MEYYNGGCLICRSKRYKEDGLNYDMYFKDEVSKTLIRIGLCKTCFADPMIDLGEVKEKLIESEINYRKLCNKGLIDDEMKKLQRINFVGRKGWEKFWEDVKSKYPDVAESALTNDQYLDVIENES